MSETINQSLDATSAPAVAPVITPVPMSFPALLLNPKLKMHVSRPSRDIEESRATKFDTTVDGKTRGKRHVRRYENVTFRNNPHIVLPNRSDYQVPHTDVKATFPIPLPPYLPRVAQAPSAVTIAKYDQGNLNSAYAGRFTMSLRGLRRDLRQRGGLRARALVQDVESAIQGWLDADTATDEARETREIGAEDYSTIKEVSHKPMELVWVTEDPFARWIIHCVSRWHGVVSFSKDVLVQTEGTAQQIQRQTHLLRPNSRHPDPRTTVALYTPTATDLESSIVDTEDSDFGGLADSVGSLQIIDAPSSHSMVKGYDLGIPEESEGNESDAESAFSLVEHPEGTRSPLGDKELKASSDVNGDQSARPPRPSERVDTVLFHATVRSDSSPSRSPIRTRRFRQSRRIVAPGRRAQGKFRSSEPPSTFMAYVYGPTA